VGCGSRDLRANPYLAALRPRAAYCTIALSTLTKYVLSFISLAVAQLVDLIRSHNRSLVKTSNSFASWLNAFRGLCGRYCGVTTLYMPANLSLHTKTHGYMNNPVASDKAVTAVQFDRYYRVYINFLTWEKHIIHDDTNFAIIAHRPFTP
jgi:hypothetical protein